MRKRERRRDKKITTSNLRVSVIKTIMQELELLNWWRTFSYSLCFSSSSLFVTFWTECVMCRFIYDSINTGSLLKLSWATSLAAKLNLSWLLQQCNVTSFGGRMHVQSVSIVKTSRVDLWLLDSVSVSHSDRKEREPTNALIFVLEKSKFLAAQRQWTMVHLFENFLLM